MYNTHKDVFKLNINTCRKEILNLRPNINKSALQKVLSLATANDRFYWVDGTDVFYEEHHPSSNSYFHNTYPILSGLSYEKALVNLPSAQPLPVPVYPPLSVQVIFGTYVAKATWQRPHLLGVQGKASIYVFLFFQLHCTYAI